MNKSKRTKYTIVTTTSVWFVYGSPSWKTKAIIHDVKIASYRGQILLANVPAAKRITNFCTGAKKLQIVLQRNHPKLFAANVVEWHFGLLFPKMTLFHKRRQQSWKNVFSVWKRLLEIDRPKLRSVKNVAQFNCHPPFWKAKIVKHVNFPPK